MAAVSVIRVIWEKRALTCSPRRLVEEAGVLVLPSGIYRSELGPTPTDRFRIGFGRKGLEQGLAAFRAHLENAS